MSMKNSIKTNAIGLAIFAIFTAGLIAITQVITKTKIAENEQQYRARLLFEILPNADERMAEQPYSLHPDIFFNMELLSLTELGEFYRDPVTKDVILTVVAPNGYTEAIKLLVGIDTTGTIKDIRVISHRETPGLGDKIEIKKSDWILQFQGKSLTVPTLEYWKVKKDGGEFDQLSGATVTPRAVVAAIARSLEFYRLNQQQLLEAE